MFWYLVAVILILYAIIFVYKTKTGSPYVPSNLFQIEILTKYIKDGDVVADMGCGDGRVLIASIEAGAKRAEGWEIEPLIWLKCKLNIGRYNNRDKIVLKYGDMWKADLGKYDVVFVYQLEQFSNRFVEKAKLEMRKGALVIANTYQLKGLTMIAKDGPLLVYKI